MKNRLAKITLFTVSLMLSASLALAVEVKVNAPDVSGAAKATTADKTKASAATAKSAAKAKVIDINTATDTELKAIPGIGDSYASKIIAGRPYANKGQLKSRNILPGPVYEQVKDLIIARQPSKK